MYIENFKFPTTFAFSPGNCIQFFRSYQKKTVFSPFILLTPPGDYKISDDDYIITDADYIIARR